MSFQRVEVSPIDSLEYQKLVPADQTDRVRRLGESLNHARVVHVNSTAIGGGVAEILKSMVPYMNDAGVSTRWLAMEGSPEFFEITKRLHNMLQGAEGNLSQAEMEVYVGHSSKMAAALTEQGITADLWVLHDPQTLPLVSYLPREAQVIWVCHIDTTRPNKQVIKQLLPFMRQANRTFFSMEEYVVQGLDTSLARVIPPAIDPLITKNREPDLDTVLPTLARLGVDPERPVMTQVARFDVWKDPCGVIDAYRLVKQKIPEVQLALLGVIDAKDDPEAFSVLESVREHVGEDPDIHLFADPNQVGQPEVAAFQKGSDVVIQKSLREGFGLSVTEALWKGTPAIGGNCGGIRLQIGHGETGYLVDSVEECASYTLELMRSPKKARWMGIAARERVRQRFLLPRLLGDYLDVMSDMLGNQTNSLSTSFQHAVSNNGENLQVGAPHV